MGAKRLKILVTGASGFVGGAFMRRFAGAADLALFGVGRRPVALANYAQADLTSEFSVPFVPDVVIHCAARASPWGSRLEFERQNVRATQNVIRFCERHGLPKLVYISSSSVFYRHEHQFALTEASPVGPRFVNFYAQTKHAGELEARRYAGAHVILRPRAVFGPGDTVLFPRILRAAQEGRLPLFVQSGPPARGDLIYIDTLCDYMLGAATRREVTGDFNLTNAQPVVMQDFLLQTLAALGLSAPKKRVHVRTALRVARAIEMAYRLLRLPGEPPITRFGVSVFAYSKTFDVAKALAVLGPPTVGLDEGIARFIAWQRNQR